MSDTNTEARGKIARAIVYAARQALEAMRIEATAAMEARQEALANKVDRDDFAQKWATLKGECHAQNQRANQAEKDNAELLRLLQETRASLELSRQLATDLQHDVNRITQDRNGFRRGAQFWMDSSKDRQAERDAAEAKVVKLRTVLQNAISDPFNASLNTINHVLDETK